jgi:hypothetical protein
VPCPNGKHCDNGACFCNDTTRADCGSSCADLMSDPLNCGLCGNVCGMGTSCVGGACLATGCAGGKRVCAGVCTDTQTDPANCGMCGNACGGGRVCVAGACQCPSGLAFCGASCVNLQTDGLNCSACGRSCSGGTCANGICQCPPGQQLCSGVCATTQVDPMNCGTCGHNCAATQACVNGTCTCGPGTTLCNGSCIPTGNDNANCGGCNIGCPANAWCTAGSCQPLFICGSNFSMPPTGCSTFPLTAAACGQTSLGSSIPWMGTNTGSVTQTLTRNPASEIRISGLATISGSLITYNPDAAIVSEISFGCCCGGCGSAQTYDLTTTGSAWACATPTTAVLSTSGSYNLSIDYYSFSGHYNTGGTQPGTPTDFTKDPGTGRVCDEVCGDVKNLCGDDRQYYRVGLPARKALDLQTSFATRGGNTTFDLQAMSISGTLLCSIIAGGAATTTPAAFNGRVLNNTDVDQTILIAPIARPSGNLTWNMSVGVEP